MVSASDQEKKLSFCEIVKDDTSEVFQKLESKMPHIMQIQSDMYKEYLHMFDDVFGTCYIAEKEFFDKLNIDKETLEQIKKNSELIKQTYLKNIDMGSQFFENYAKMRVSTIRSFDNYFHVMMESYAKMLSQFNKTF